MLFLAVRSISRNGTKSPSDLTKSEPVPPTGKQTLLDHQTVLHAYVVLYAKRDGSGYLGL
jgi:hypothetical protein